jgi:NAD(P)-dependent dehydrogenase (short-subunit alcohol dehydrogenase family)
MKNDHPFKNLTALVTGASSGIGEATSIALARQGANRSHPLQLKAGEADVVLKKVRARRRSGAGAGRPDHDGRNTEAVEICREQSRSTFL